MNNDGLTEQHLQEMIGTLPEREAPAGMTEQILEKITAQDQEGVGRKIIRLLTGPFSIRLHPLRLAGTICSLAFVFWLGVTAGSLRSTGDDTATEAAASLAFPSADAEANFFIGRGLLAAGLLNESVTFLRQASLRVPENPEYALWEGVVLGKLGDRVGERDRYRKTLDLHPDYLPARLYLGHALLENGQPDAALKEYSHVLEVEPDDEIALYNSALAFQLLGEKARAAAAWKEYLQVYRDGTRAFRAVLHLNELGDFTFRSYQIGYRKIILNQEVLLGVNPAGKQDEIELLTDFFKKASGDVLEVIVFLENDMRLAGSHASNLKHHISDNLAGSDGKTVNISWFGQPERMITTSGKKFWLGKGLLIFSKPQQQTNQEKMI